MTREISTAGTIVHETEEGLTGDLLGRRGGDAGMAADLRQELRADTPCHLAGLDDAEITVHHTVDERGFHTFRVSTPCTQPGCVVLDRERRWVSELHQRLDAAAGGYARRRMDDPLERVFSEFEGVYVWAACEPTEERLKRAAYWRSELTRLAAARFPDLPALIE